MKNGSKWKLKRNCLTNEKKKRKEKTYPNFWDTVNAILRDKFIGLSAFIKQTNKQKSISKLTAHMKSQKQKEEITAKGIRHQEIIKLKAKSIN